MSLLSEKPGGNSTLRLQVLIITVVAMVIALAACILSYIKGNGDIGVNTLALILGLVTSALGGKILQKKQESKTPNPSPEEPLSFHK